jgi:hypothetical protein
VGGERRVFAHDRRAMPQHGGLERGIAAARVHRGADDPRERVDETLLQRGAGRSAVGELAARFVDHGRDDDGRIRRVVERRRRHERRQSVTAIDGAQDFVEQGG